jgi:hypothetical protein
MRHTNGKEGVGMSKGLKGTAALAIALVAIVAAGCGGSILSSSDSPASLTGRVTGAPVGGGSATASAASSAARATVTVTVEEDPSLTASVGADGTFTLRGLPANGFTLIFRWGREEARLRLTGVRGGQRITITVRLSGGQAVLLEDQRDGESDSTCARGAGFWCQNQDGGNPNMTAAQFRDRAERAAQLLAAVPHLNSASEIAAAVCNTGDQLSRQLATLALNLAAELVDSTTPLEDEEFRGRPLATVADALAAGIQVANGSQPVSRGERNEIKDVLERVNENQNTDSPCGADEDPEEEEPEEDSDDGATMTICHIPPGNPSARQTLVIGAAAWPAHRGHGDYQGACR